MNTKILMMITALFLGLIGVTLAFMPQEVAVFLNMGSNQYTELATQLLGALYLGFAMLNWMAKDNLMGGIYGKPVAMSNLMHFVVGAFALLKMLSNITMHWEYMVAFTVLYLSVCESSEGEEGVSSVQIRPSLTVFSELFIQTKKTSLPYNRENWF